MASRREQKGLVQAERKAREAIERQQQQHCKGDFGTCGFCGVGGGRLRETGDETSQLLHAAIRTGEPGSYEYSIHPKANPPGCQTITWCGHCVGGLIHKFQRYDDTNLRAAQIAAKVRLELDGIRWSHWEAASDPEEHAALQRAHPPDDPAIHLEKLRLQDDIGDMQNEIFRRAGYDLTTRGWRP